MLTSSNTYNSSSARCHLRTECRAKRDREYFNDLFEDDWKVFVIKRDKQNDAFNWFTLCCEPENNSCR
jgi:hypothetical protein